MTIDDHPELQRFDSVDWAAAERERVANKQLAYRQFKTALSSQSPDQVIYEVNQSIALSRTEQLVVNSFVDVYHRGIGSQMEITEMLFSLLYRKYSNLVQIFYEMKTPQGNMYFSTLAFSHHHPNRWSAIERTDDYLAGKINGMSGTLDSVVDGCMEILQKYYNAKTLYAGTGLVSLQGNMTPIAEHVEKIKRFYKER